MVCCFTPLSIGKSVLTAAVAVDHNLCNGLAHGLWSQAA